MTKAILAGNEGDVSAAADRLASEISGRAAKTMREMGIYKIRVLAILNDQQINALKTQYGESGLVHLLGWPGGFKGFGHSMGHPGMRFGPGR